LNLDRLLAAIGILIGLPSFLLLFFSGNFVIGIFVFIILCGIAWFYYHENFLGPFNAVMSKKCLELLDKEGRKAKITLDGWVKPNHKGLHEFVLANIRSDGRIENFNSNFGTPLVKKEAGGYIVHIRFPNELKKGRLINVILTYDIIDGYLSNNESTSGVVEHLTKEMEFEALFPKNRPFLDTSVYKISGSDRKELHKPSCSEDHLRISWKMKRFFGLERGAFFKLEWTW
jgi:hypothetical protein